ncbi:hypothetical protein V8G54_004972 [Vigna mungo]|uniref:Retrotransposon gag domain-containing protein n=1 Tax=Vigna mungo TaxID=3915 RepID=A0AAQ3PDH0_VIGMU
MERKLHALENRIEGRMSALEIAGEELKADAMGIRQDLKKLREWWRGWRKIWNDIRKEVRGPLMAIGGREERAHRGEERARRKNWRTTRETHNLIGARPDGMDCLSGEILRDPECNGKGEAPIGLCLLGRQRQLLVTEPKWEEFRDAVVRRLGGRERGTVFEKLALLQLRGSVEDYVQEFEMLVPKQEEPQNPKDLLTAMEVAWDVKEVGRSQKLNNEILTEVIQGTVARSEPFKEGQSRTNASENLSVPKKERIGGTETSRTGSNYQGETRGEEYEGDHSGGRRGGRRRGERGREGTGAHGAVLFFSRGPHPTENYEATRMGEWKKNTILQGESGGWAEKNSSGMLGGLLVLEGLEVKEKFYLFDLGGVDVILGVAWLARLARLGEMKVNWGELTLRFESEEKEVEIQGDPTLTCKVVTPEALLKEREIETMPLEVGLHHMLANFNGVFQEPQRLPAERKIVHRITLNEDRLQIQINSVQFVHAMEVLYMRLHNKYTKVKTKQLSDLEHQEVIEQLKTEKRELLGQVNDLRVELASLKAAKDN